MPINESRFQRLYFFAKSCYNISINSVVEYAKNQLQSDLYNPGGIMQSVDRIVTILELLADSSKGLGITELYEACDLPKSTLHRILTSLVAYDLAFQDAQTKKYRLGSAMLRLGAKYLGQNDVRNIARPFLEQAEKELRETVYLSVLQGGRVICVDTVSTSRDINYFLSVGKEMPFNTSASAKAILAYQPEDFIESVLKSDELIGNTANSITEPAILEKHLASIRIRGYSICEEEMEEGATAISAPIWDWRGQVSASVSVIAPSVRLQGIYRQGVIDVLLATAQVISRQWGMTGNF